MTDYHEFTNIDTPSDERARLGVGDIWINAAKCKKCGEVVRSENRHDYKACKCGSVVVDGGSWYAKRGGDHDAMENQIVPFNDIKDEEEI